MKLVLLRHGLTEANEKRLYCGSSDLPLSASGRTALEELRKARKIDTSGLKMITSGMRRTNETLKVLFDCTADYIDLGLCEIDFGEFECLDYERLKSVQAYREWIADESGDLAPPGGESANAFRDRVLDAASRLDADSLIVTHGGVIAALMANWFPEEGKNRWDWQPDFGRGYVVFLEEQRSYRGI